MSKKDTPARELAELEAKMRGDPLKREPPAALARAETRNSAPVGTGHPSPVGVRIGRYGRR
jgi:hypothetical protein